MRMILIADSGSTKTDWCLADSAGNDSKCFTTQGINPFHQSPQEVAALLHKEVLPQLNHHLTKISSTFFYGAGCTTEKAPTLKALLQEALPQTACVEVASDMLGAARSLCGHRPGIVGILGTGSNSCYYDGEGIVQNVPPLGYILGDEGSGTALGKRLIGDCLKGLLPEELCKRFLVHCRLTQSEIIERVYRQPLANRFLAECSRFLHEHRQEESIHRLLTECFGEFIRRNLLSYPAGELFFTGSIACCYAEELQEAAKQHGLHIAAIRPHPIEGLITFHTQR